MSSHKLTPVLTDFGVEKDFPFRLHTMIEFTVVNYCGFPVAVPKGFKWLALDLHGILYAYKRKPRKTPSNWSWYPHPKDEDNPDAYFEIIDLVAHNYVSEVTKDQSNNSLVKVKKLPKYYP